VLHVQLDTAQLKVVLQHDAEFYVIVNDQR
jgi:hypothetical protein